MKSIIFALAIAAAQAIQLKASQRISPEEFLEKEFRPLAADLVYKLNGDKAMTHDIY